ncbi:MAG: hypothetical protein KKE11_00870 [Gammaproteobacteria bacterium]|nr:hypothetical protein [Gammaproteobacteria bacterium]
MNILELNQQEISSVAGSRSEFSVAGLLKEMSICYIAGPSAGLLTQGAISGIIGVKSIKTRSADSFHNKLDWALLAGAVYIFTH